MLENKSYCREGIALRMNQSFAFEFLCENFQPKLINSYSNFKQFFIFYCATWAYNIIKSLVMDIIVIFLFSHIYLDIKSVIVVVRKMYFYEAIKGFWVMNWHNWLIHVISDKYLIRKIYGNLAWYYVSFADIYVAIEIMISFSLIECFV